MTFPHWPFVDGISVPEGNGGRTEELIGGSGGEVGLGVDVGVGLGSGTASPQRPKSGWHPTISPQYCNWCQIL